MTTYEFVQFQTDSIELPDEDTVVAANYNPNAMGRSWVLVARENSGQDVCGVNGCQRSVSDDGPCWQHSDED